MTERGDRPSGRGGRESGDDWDAIAWDWQEQDRDRAFVALLDRQPELAAPGQRAYWETINGRLVQHVASPAERDRVRLAVVRWLRAEPKPPASWRAVRRLSQRKRYGVWVVARRIEINWVMPEPGFIMHLDLHRPTLVNADTYDRWVTRILPNDRDAEDLAPVVAWQRGPEPAALWASDILKRYTEGAR